MGYNFVAAIIGLSSFV